MAPQPLVFIDDDADGTYVIVERATGVRYQHQHGGGACFQGVVEGYLVPVDGSPAREILDDVFLRRHGGVGVPSHLMEPGDLDDIRRAVGMIQIWSSEEGSSLGLLRVDEDRIAELDEAWIPVLTADGPGVLVWPSSD